MADRERQAGKEEGPRIDRAFLSWDDACPNSDFEIVPSWTFPILFHFSCYTQQHVYEYIRCELNSTNSLLLMAKL